MTIVHHRPSYADIMSTLAVVLALVGGGTALAAQATRGSVGSAAVKNNSIRSADLRDGAAVRSKDVADNSLTGVDIDESTLAVTAQGPAGGSLTGTYPNPTIARDAVGPSSVADNSLTRADLGPDSVGAAELVGLVKVEQTESIPAGAKAAAVATCPAGSTVISGGGRTFASDVFAVGSSKENVTQAWVWEVKNSSGAPQNVTAFAYCLPT